MTVSAAAASTGVPFASAEAFARVDFERPIASTPEVSPARLRDVFHQAASEADAGEAERSVFTVLGLACCIFLDPADAASPWRPMATFRDGSTTVTPENFKGPQAAVFADVMTGVGHPGLRARLADSVWSLDRRAPAAARIAISAYLECAFGMMDGRYSPRFPKAGGAAQEVVGALHRAMQISRVISGKGGGDREIRRCLDLAVAFVLTHRDYVPFVALAEAGLEYKWLTPRRPGACRRRTTSRFPFRSPADGWAGGRAISTAGRRRGRARRPPRRSRSRTGAQGTRHAEPKRRVPHRTPRPGPSNGPRGPQPPVRTSVAERRRRIRSRSTSDCEARAHERPV